MRREWPLRASGHANTIECNAFLLRPESYTFNSEDDEDSTAWWKAKEYCMASRKKAASSRKRSDRTLSVAGAIKRGRAQAKAVLAFREAQRATRAEAVAVRPARRRAAAPSASAIPPRTRRALGARASAGLLIAEGDSWFDYPLNDVLRLLEDRHGYDVESVAHKGDRVEDIAYSQGQFEEFARRLEKLLRRDEVPDAILLSGGGNDIAGDDFAMLLNHADSTLPAINHDVVRGVIDVRLRTAYVSLIAGLTEISKQYLSRPIPIVTHGYDYPVPDGRGFLGGWGFLPGPWLQPGFHQKGHVNLAKNVKVMRNLIDAFNSMLKQVSEATELRHVRYLDLRKTLKSNTEDWANELHPTGRGFELVAAKFARAIRTL